MRQLGDFVYGPRTPLKVASPPPPNAPKSAPRVTLPDPAVNRMGFKDMEDMTPHQDK